MKLYLIRHGETDWNRLLRFQGREDVPLNETGIRQAEACGKALSDSGIQAVFTSPLKRARRTGEIIAAASGLGCEKVFDLPELIERDLGEYSGKYIKDRSDYFALSAGTDAGGMEPFDSVLARMELALRKLSDTKIPVLAAVSHGAAINVLLAGLSNHAVGTGKTRLLNGGISIIEGDAQNGFQITACNLAPETLKAGGQAHL